MVIKVLDIVPACDTAAQGAAVARVVCEHLKENASVAISFEGVFDVPSSFVNTSIVSILFDCKPHANDRSISITDVTPQIADMIRRCVGNRRARDEKLSA
ncbi:MAG: DUF4325 domain-containing protein [Gammaproteobacteria bacterium]|nr:DUF4325 domain-containing protein [Gammaproteobacteria bacterium]